MAVDKLVLVPVWRDAGDVFSARERVALAWAETVTRVADTGVPDADYEAAAAEFSDKELADLTYAIGLMNAFNRLGVAFRSTPAAASPPRPESAWPGTAGLAGILEIAFAFGMKSSEGFTRRMPSLFTVATGLSSVLLLSLSLRTLPVGTGYAVWTGIGAAGTAILGIVALGNSASPH